MHSVVSGYAGGATKNPTYEQVCSGGTGHAEVIKIDFDPSRISFRDLMTVFFATHDPTTLNRQGNDVGTSYRSEIFYVSEAQRGEALRTIDDVNASGLWPGRVVTTVSPVPTAASESTASSAPASDADRLWPATAPKRRA